ncbi:MAG: hypothetical protein ACI8UR_002272 [Natronomonas sp.]|jgi:hypothetical protein|uniref:hypothetical protein n=1 Tax=Natronomonas sp. TaxID=2184060 RepID=UPI003988A3C4
MSSTRNDVSADRRCIPAVDTANGVRRRLNAIRIREHLRRTETALRDAEHDHLTPLQRRRRERHLNRLTAYRRRGEFPTNRSDHERVPLFVGSDGTPCALAHLMLEAGHENFVESVLAEDPTVRIETLPDDHPVVEWVEANGLTKTEAARIQPTYPEGVQFATTCGPVPCWLAGAFVTLVGTAVFAASESVGYRLASEVFPDNALKRKGVLGYLTVLNLFLAPLLALVLFALFP